MLLLSCAKDFVLFPSAHWHCDHFALYPPITKLWPGLKNQRSMHFHFRQADQCICRQHIRWVRWDARYTELVYIFVFCALWSCNVAPAQATRGAVCSIGCPGRRGDEAPPALEAFPSCSFKKHLIWRKSWTCGDVVDKIPWVGNLCQGPFLSGNWLKSPKEFLRWAILSPILPQGWYQRVCCQEGKEDSSRWGWVWDGLRAPQVPSVRIELQTSSPKADVVLTLI